jgi:cytolysin-activating lysine-acyltransferase
MAARKPPAKSKPSSAKARSAKAGNGAGKARANSRPKSRAQPKAERTAARQDKTIANVLGEIVWLMARSPGHSKLTIGEVEAHIMPAIDAVQFRVFHAGDKVIGAALWAFATPEVAQRLAGGDNRLAPADWSGGDELWIVDLVAPFGAEHVMLEDLKEGLFKTRDMKFRGEKDGKVQIYTL